ncbi:hypothetical protein chiPu_0029158, partial [Chiloscyllium punctatum]|nr:hypothetical protein [Chiloscyllium punctatum]
ELWARRERYQQARPGALAIPHDPAGDGRTRRWAVDLVWHDGRRGAAADPGRDLQPLRHARPGAAISDHRAAVAARSHLGRGKQQSEDRIPLRPGDHRAATRARPRHSGDRPVRGVHGTRRRDRLASGWPDGRGQRSAQRRCRCDPLSRIPGARCRIVRRAR